MRVELNLASEPFGGKRAFWTLVSVTGGLLMVTLIALVWTFVSSNDLPEELVVQEQQLKAELVTVAQAEAQANSKINTAVGVEILDRSAFLNQLLLRKSTLR